MKPTKEQIDDLLKRGIKPGAVIRCATSPDSDYDGDLGDVEPIEDWRLNDNAVIVGNDNNGAMLYGVMSGVSYATVIIPAPEDVNPKPRHALKDGDYVVRTDKAMYDRLMALCDKAGVEVYEDSRPYYDTSTYTQLGWFDDMVQLATRGKGRRQLTEVQFIAALFGVAPQEPVKELTLEVAKELLRESIGHVLNNDAVGQRKWSAKLAEYGIKP